MKLLLDNNVPAKLRKWLKGHVVHTSWYEGLDRVSDAVLLSAAAAMGFEAVITGDKDMPFQMNLQRLPCSLILLDTSPFDLSHVEALVPRLEQVLETIVPNTFVSVRVQPSR